MSRSAMCRAVLLGLIVSIPVHGLARGGPAGRPDGPAGRPGGPISRPDPAGCPPDVAQAVAATCPCNGALQGGQLLPWRNHGQYVRCVVQYRNALRKAGCLSSAAQRGLVRCAAQAPCGKPGAAVACCITTPGLCSDPAPDGIKAGTCSNAPAVVCDVAGDCAVTTTEFVDDPLACTAGGGTVEGDGAVCSVCGIR